MHARTKAFFDGYDHRIIREHTLDAKKGETMYWVKVTGIDGVILVQEYGGGNGFEVYTAPTSSNLVDDTRKAVFGDSA